MVGGVNPAQLYSIRIEQMIAEIIQQPCRVSVWFADPSNFYSLFPVVFFRLCSRVFAFSPLQNSVRLTWWAEKISRWSIIPRSLDMNIGRLEPSLGTYLSSCLLCALQIANIKPNSLREKNTTGVLRANVANFLQTCVSFPFWKTKTHKKQFRFFEYFFIFLIFSSLLANRVCLFRFFSPFFLLFGHSAIFRLFPACYHFFSQGESDRNPTAMALLGSRKSQASEERW